MSKYRVLNEEFNDLEGFNTKQKAVESAIEYATESPHRTYYVAKIIGSTVSSKPSFEHEQDCE